MIVVAEDYSDTVLGLKLFLEGACVDLGVQHAIVQCTRADELESHLVDCERHGTPLLLILDNVMDLPGGPYDLKQHIIKLWRAAPGTWRSRVPVIIFVRDPKEFRGLPERMNSAIINQIPEAGQNNWLELRTAIRRALRALMQPA